jgi:hypothetical protein
MLAAPRDLHRIAGETADLPFDSRGNMKYRPGRYPLPTPGRNAITEIVNVKETLARPGRGPRIILGIMRAPASGPHSLAPSRCHHQRRLPDRCMASGQRRYSSSPVMRPFICRPALVKKRPASGDGVLRRRWERRRKPQRGNRSAVRSNADLYYYSLSKLRPQRNQRVVEGRLEKSRKR